jgi:hypothetical protein
MSCFIVSNHTINRIVELNHRASFRTSGPLLHVSPFMHAESYEDCQRVGQALHTLNREAYAIRYPEEPLTADTYEFTHTYDGPITEERQLLPYIRAIDCYLYQCGEGKIPERSTLYQIVKRFRDSLRDAVIVSLPEYKAADWD